MENILKVFPHKMSDIVPNIRSTEMKVHGDSIAGNRLVLRTRILPVLNVRAIAKIGMNFLTKVHGVDVAQDSAFNEIKSFIRGESLMIA